MLSLPPTLCELGARHWHTRSTYARHRIRHGIRHTAARAGRRHCPSVANERLRHMLIGYARGGWVNRCVNVSGGVFPLLG